MSKIIFKLLLILGFTNAVLSQMTLTSSFAPAPGDVQVDVRADTTGITQGNSGANQVWNFPTLIRVDSTTAHWMLPSSTPYASLFPSSNLALLDTCYNYYNSQSSYFEVVGYYSHGEAVHYQNPETILTFPFTYNSTMSDNFITGFYNSGDSVYETGTETALGDAFGTINLPFGTFINSLRIKHTINLYDTSITYQQAFHTTYTIYEWYIPNKKFSVFKIIYMTFTLPVPPYNFTYKNVFYNPASPPIGIQKIGKDVPEKYNLSQNYPNPFNPNTKIKFDLPHPSEGGAQAVKLVIYDLLGREISTLVNEKLSPGTYEADFDGSNFSSGVYFYRLKTDSYSETKRMMLVK